MKKNKTKNIASIACVTIGLTGVVTMTGAFMCKNTSHLTQYCPLNDVFGIEHQVNIIDDLLGEHGYKAFAEKDGYVTIESATKKTNSKDGTEIYTAPAGFMLSGNKATKQYIVPPKTIIVTKGTHINDDEGNLEDQIWDPKVTNVITKYK